MPVGKPSTRLHVPVWGAGLHLLHPIIHKPVELYSQHRTGRLVHPAEQWLRWQQDSFCSVFSPAVSTQLSLLLLKHFYASFTLIFSLRLSSFLKFLWNFLVMLWSGWSGHLSLDRFGANAPQFYVFDKCIHWAHLYSYLKSCGYAGHSSRVCCASTPPKANPGSLAPSPALHKGRTDSEPLLCRFSREQRWMNLGEHRKGACFLLHPSGISW